MHKLGKAFLWLAIPVIIAAFMLTTMLLDIRSKWRKAMETAQVSVAESTETRAKELRKVLTLEEEISREQHAWGDAWTSQNSQPAGRSGMIQLGVGSGSGLGQKGQSQQKPLPDIFLFSMTGGQSTEFVGQFKLAALNVDNSTAQLTRTPYPGEEQAWPAGAYRVRDTIPAGWRYTFAELEGQMLIASRKLEGQKELLDTLNTQIVESQKSLDQRLAELNGNANAPPGASQEVVDGLVSTIRRLEFHRDAVLAQVDKLRHELNDQYVQLRATMDANAAMLESLSGQAATSSEETSNQVTIR